MDKLIDFARWMKDVPISVTGFRDADAEILTALSYIDYTPLFQEKRDIYTISDCERMLQQGKLDVLITGSTAGFPELLEVVARSKRYGEIRISNYVEMIRHEPPLQFSAVTFCDDEDLRFISYRGTDNSLVGWKEDFMLSFTRTESQEEALKYARDRIAEGGRWRIGGHSKGGNLVLYVGCMLTDEELEHLEHIYLLDGPGFCPEVLDVSLQERIDARTTRIIPKYCVVGKLFEPKIKDTRIVQSSESGFLQHNLITWGIDHGDLALAVENDPESTIVNHVVENWLSEIGMEERIVFIEELFGALEAGGADTINQIQAGGRSGMYAILRKLRAASKTTKQALTEFTKFAMLGKFEDIKGDIRHKLNNVVDLKKDDQDDEESETKEQKEDQQ